MIKLKGVLSIFLGSLHVLSYSKSFQITTHAGSLRGLDTIISPLTLTLTSTPCVALFFLWTTDANFVGMVHPRSRWQSHSPERLNSGFTYSSKESWSCQVQEWTLWQITGPKSKKSLPQTTSCPTYSCYDGKAWLVTVPCTTLSIFHSRYKRKSPCIGLLLYISPRLGI